jgi:hypothetical protein
MSKCSSDPSFRSRTRRRRNSTEPENANDRPSSNGSFQQPQSLLNLSPVQMAQRSNSKAVKQEIADLEDLCCRIEERNNSRRKSSNLLLQVPRPEESVGDDLASAEPSATMDSEASSSTSSSTSIGASRIMVPPEKECSLISQWAMDAYYRVVITKCNGIATICHAMEVFPDHERIQASCCTALLLLLAPSSHSLPPTSSTSSLQTMNSGGGGGGATSALAKQHETPNKERATGLVLAAKERHAQSQIVQIVVKQFLQQEQQAAAAACVRSVTPAALSGTTTTAEPQADLSGMSECNLAPYHHHSLDNGYDHNPRYEMLQPHSMDPPPSRVEPSSRSLTTVSDTGNDSRRTPQGGGHVVKALPSDSLMLPFLEQQVKDALLFSSLPLSSSSPRTWAQKSFSALDESSAAAAGVRGLETFSTAELLQVLQGSLNSS